MAHRYPKLHAAAASFWREWYRELRRHAGDERFPYEVRTRLRAAAERALDRSAREERRAVVPRLDRRLLRAVAEGAAATGGARRIVTIEARGGAARLADAIALLSSEGYEIARIAGPADVDEPQLRASAFVVCSSIDVQHAAYRAQRPSLLIDARDPFTAYPVRHDSLFMLATAIDLDTGRPLAAAALLTEGYFRNTRNCGYRPATAAEIAAAVSEMIDGVRRGWTETGAQARFRTAVADAGAALGSRVRHIAEWDAAGGFVGDGRLARAQAERAL